MKIRAYCKEHVSDGVSKIVRQEIEFTSDVIDALWGYCPAIPSINDKEGFVGILSRTGNIERKLYEEVLEEFFNKDVQMRKTFCMYVSPAISINKDANNLSAAEAIEATKVFIKYKLLSEKTSPEMVYFELLTTMGLIDPVKYVTKILPTGHVVLCIKAHGIDMQIHGQDDSVQMLYRDDNVVFVYKTGAIELEDIPFKVVSCIPIVSNNITIENHPIFEISAKIELQELQQPSRVTKPWVDSAARFVGVNISGLETKEALDKIYEELNVIANQKDNKPKRLWFLLSDDFVRKAPIKQAPTASAVLSKEKAIGFMARRQGTLILPGNPNFNEGTLRNGAVWHIAELIKE